MSIRLKIFAFQAIVALMLLGTAAATWISIARIDYYFDRSRLSREQMDTVIRLSAHMNRYSENIAEMLLLGRTELDDFFVARSSLEDSLDELADLVEREFAFVRTDVERAAGTEELAHARAMRDLFESIDLTAQRLMFLRDQGRQDEAVRLFREEIEERMDEDLEEFISAAILHEERELEAIDTRTNQLERRLVTLVIGVCLAALAVSITAAALLARSLTRPIAALTSGTRAIGEGNLSYRIDYPHRDEFADLAEQFNIATARLEAQHNQLLEVQAGLEDEVARRTHQLADANGRLQRLDEMRMLFLADIGHELRTPLTVLRGEAEVALRGTRPTEEHRETLGRIVTLTQQMGRLVEDLLFLSRAEVGAIRFEMQPIALADVLDVALAEGRVLASAHGLLIHATLPDAPCTVEGDAERLVQALLIVIDNAVKYAEAGGTIEIEVACDGPEATITVRNPGPEIPASDLPFVFNRFYRGQAGRSTTGSGLGLAIAKWIVDTHGGGVALESRNRQTTVTIGLPHAA
jgi:signal transduction histidine kinase